MSDADQWVSAETARLWWKALMGNACALVDDADLLAVNGSAGRARALIVLSMEELAKAKWLYDAAFVEWNRPLGLAGRDPAPAGNVLIPEQLRTVRRPHIDKLIAAEQFAAELPGFWGR